MTRYGACAFLFSFFLLVTVSPSVSAAQSLWIRNVRLVDDVAWSQSSPAIDGNHVVFVASYGPMNPKSDVYVKDLQTGVLTRVTYDGHPKGQPDIEDDMVSWEYFEDNRTYFQVKTLSQNVTRTIEYSSPAALDLQMDGNRLLWYGRPPVWHFPWERHGIFTYNLTTGEETEVFSSEYDLGSPRISGQIVVWDDDSQESHDIYIKHLDTGVMERLTSGLRQESDPDVCGDLVAWTDWGEPGVPDEDIVVRNLRTNETQRIPSVIEDVSPVILGRRVAWLGWSPSESESDVYFSDLDVGSIIQVTDTPHVENQVDMSDEHIVWVATLSDYSHHVFVADIITSSRPWGLLLVPPSLFIGVASIAYLAWRRKNTRAKTEE